MAYLVKLEESGPAPFAGTPDIDAYLGPIHRIAVFRALGLGDLICATPALAALRQQFPHAHISLIGQPWAAEFAARLDSVDEFIAFPGHPQLPEPPADPQGWETFVLDMQSRGIDLLIQLHGSGTVTNGLMTQLGARHVAAFHEPHRLPPEPVLGVPWNLSGTEPMRLLAMMRAFGWARPGETPRLDFPWRQSDQAAARALMRLRSKGTWRDHPYVCIHPGAQLASRRWPASRFAEVAATLSQQGYTIVLTGVHSEAELGQQIEAAVPGPCINLIGLTSLWSMGALIRGATLLVCNDTGVSHVAAALGTRSVVISCGADVARWAPANHGLHRVLWATAPCRPCAHTACPSQHECALAIEPRDVLEAAKDMLPQAA
ncbi:MAG: glycosyltransferase family 9 protein [Acidobacteriota bacterium]